MIDPDRRNAIYQLHLAGVPLGKIGRQFHISPRTVRTIIRQQGAMPQTVRKDKIHIDPELLGRLYQQCDGWLQRVHEILVEDEGVQVSYPTLTRLVRELGLGQPANARCEHVPDEPGVEMQHDTSVYKVKLAGHPTRVIASLLYLRYSKRRYLKFYRVFNRFAMKCFLHEALLFWGYAAKQCIIDNTNLARLRGSGKQAVIVPEMASFAERYGFTFLCHAIGHANRKAGEERSFWTVETNFLPGRSFQSLEDLNQQAFQWATVRMENRPASKTRLIPAKAFEHERHYLTELPAQLPAPYWPHERGTDEYGYVLFLANYYWVPGTKQEDVKVLQYADRLKIYRRADPLGRVPAAGRWRQECPFQPRGTAAASLSAQASQPRLPARGTAVAGPGPGGGRLCGLRPPDARHPAAPLPARVVRALAQGDAGRVRRGPHPGPALSRGADGNTPAHRLALHEPGTGTPARRGGGRELPPASGLPGGLSDRRAGPVRL